MGPVAIVERLDAVEDSGAKLEPSMFRSFATAFRASPDPLGPPPPAGVIHAQPRLAPHPPKSSSSPRFGPAFRPRVSAPRAGLRALVGGPGGAAERARPVVLRRHCRGAS
jgi:hypothetical protein